ncbi:MAG: WYL domain-containing protein, partial [Firmicutes bacterium]|nr:WYL domain-containing protein [Bacillota bacterium]
IFAVDRIRELEVLAEKFDYPADFNIEKYLEGVWGIMRGEPYPAAIKFDRFQARWIRERPLREKESLEETPDGGVIFRTEVSGLTEIKQWALSFGGHAEVLEPEELREEIRREVERMREIYGQDSTPLSPSLPQAEKKGKGHVGEGEKTEEIFQTDSW